MIKRIIIGLFAILIPVCILSFVAAGVLNIFLGEKPYHSSNSSEYSDYEKRWTVSDTTKVYDFSFPAMSSLTFKLSGVKADIVMADCDKIHVSVQNHNEDRSAEVVLETYGNTSTIEVHPSNITFSSISGGLISWIDDIFGNEPKCTVTVKVPQGIYQKLTVQQGSGDVSINNIIANYNDIDIGSGSFYFVKSSVKAASSIDVDLGSGKAVLENANSDSYNFNIGSGEFSAKGLTGTGDVNIGSGNVTLSYQRFFYLDLSKGSGTLNMLVPPSTSIAVNPSIGSGKIEIDTDNANKTVTDSKDFYIGDEDADAQLHIYNGSGNIYIKNNDGDDFVEVPQISDADSRDIIDEGSSGDSEFSDNLNSGVFGVEPLPDNEQNNTFSSSSSFFGVEPLPAEADDESSSEEVGLAMAVGYFAEIDQADLMQQIVRNVHFAAFV